MSLGFNWEAGQKTESVPADAGRHADADALGGACMVLGRPCSSVSSRGETLESWQGQARSTHVPGVHWEAGQKTETESVPADAGRHADADALEGACRVLGRPGTDRAG